MVRIVIRSMPVFVFVIAALTLPSTTRAQDKSAAPWAHDWSAFVKQLNVEVAKQEYFVGNANTAFRGKSVTWEGKIDDIKQANKPEDSMVVLVMSPETLKARSGDATLGRIVLAPTAEEWSTWKGAAKGDTVKFTTTLDEGTFAPKCVLVLLQGQGPNAGKNFAIINTKGGKRHTK